MSEKPIDYLTTLTALGSLKLTKKLSKSTSGYWTIKDYDRARQFTVSEIPVYDISSLSEALTCLAEQSSVCIIRGELRWDFFGWSGPLPRQLSTFEENSRRWLLLDMDTVRVPDDIDIIDDPERLIEHVRDQLPPAFRNVTCHWTLTSGHGIKPTPRVRLAFWLNRPWRNPDLKRWLADAPIDASLFSPVQCHYTASPIFLGGLTDFIPRRNGLLLGADDEVLTPTMEETRSWRTAPPPPGAGGTDFSAESVEAALDRMGDPPEVPNGVGFHAAVGGAIKAARRKFGASIDPAALLARIDFALDERGQQREARQPGYIAARKRDARTWLAWHIRKAQEEGAGSEACDPPASRPTMSPPAVRDIIRASAGSFIAKATNTAVARREAIKMRETGGWTGLTVPTPPEGAQLLLAAGIGAGKSTIVLEEAARELGGGNPQDGGEPKRRAGYVVGNHKLAQDIAERFRKIAPEVDYHIYLGADQPDPDHADFNDPSIPGKRKTKMCRRAAMIRDVLAAGGSVDTLCQGGACPHHPDHRGTTDICGRKRQSIPKEGLVILAGPSIPTEAPPVGLRRTIKINGRERVAVDCCDLLVVDEPNPLEWKHSKRSATPLKLARKLTRFPGDHGSLDDETDALVVSHALGILAGEIADLKPGPIVAETVRALAQIADWQQIKRSAFAFLPDTKAHLKPCVGSGEVTDMLGELKKHAGPIFGIARLCDTLIEAEAALQGHPADALSGLIALEKPDIGKAPSLSLRGTKPIHAAWLGIPTLLLDATADTDLLKRWFPRLTIEADVALATPTAVVRRQVHDCAFSYSGWVPTGEQKDAVGSELTCWNNCKWLMRYLSVKADQFRGQGRDGIDLLAIVPEGAEKALKALWKPLGGVPYGVALEHWNAIRGLDCYAGVRCQIIFSRPLPSAHELESIAWSMTGVVGTQVPRGLLPHADAAYLMRDGTARRARVRRHPDPVAESVRQAICDNEVLQGEGRARAAHRTATTPLEVMILTDVPLPGLPIDELIRRQDLDQDATTGRWLLACGVCPVPGTQGFVPLMATIEGRTGKSVAQGITRDAGSYAELFAFVTANEVPAGWGQYRVRATAEVRYSVPVWLRGEPSAALERVGLIQAFVEPMRAAHDPDMKASTQIWEQAMSLVPGGVLPLSPQWLVDNLSDLFPSVRSAERGIKTAKTSLTTDKRHIRCTSIWEMSAVSPHLAVYRVAGQRRPSKCLVVPGAADPRAELERLLGVEVTEFQIDGDLPEVVDGYGELLDPCVIGRVGLPEFRTWGDVITFSRRPAPPAPPAPPSSVTPMPAIIGRVGGAQGATVSATYDEDVLDAALLTSASMFEWLRQGHGITPLTVRG